MEWYSIGVIRPEALREVLTGRTVEASYIGAEVTDKCGDPLTVRVIIELAFVGVVIGFDNLGDAHRLRRVKP